MRSSLLVLLVVAVVRLLLLRMVFFVSSKILCTVSSCVLDQPLPACRRLLPTWTSPRISTMRSSTRAKTSRIWRLPIALSRPHSTRWKPSPGSATTSTARASIRFASPHRHRTWRAHQHLPQKNFTTFSLRTYKNVRRVCVSCASVRHTCDALECRPRG